MCMQCLTKSKIIIEDPIPGYLLTQATVGIEEWPEGYYGLVRCNDPDFVWKMKPRAEPPDSSHDDWVVWAKEAEEFDECLDTDPMTGWALVETCKKAGYDPEKYGYRVGFWLFGKLGEELENILNGA